MKAAVRVPERVMKVAICGFGTVGSGCYEVLTTNAARIAAQVGCPVEIKYICDIREFPGHPAEKLIVKDFSVIENDPEVDVVMEVMGGKTFAYDFTKRALLKGKSVCTSNKELVSAHGAELLKLAKEHNCNYFFEASVGGGIPCIRPMITSLTADRILEMKSIINGTTNYILTKMRDENMDFSDALKQAQANGFAEANPAADIEGMDAARKTSIFASLVTGKQVDVEDIYTEGITAVTATDIAYAKKLKATIRLFSLIRECNESYVAMVAPFLIRSNCQLFFVDDVFNAVTVKGNAVGDLMFYGRGAGSLPTASAVVADCVEACRNLGRTLPVYWEEEKFELASKDSLKSNFFVRVPAAEADKAKNIFNISETVDAIGDEFAFVTDVLTDSEFEAKKEGLTIINRIRCDF